MLTHFALYNIYKSDLIIEETTISEHQRPFQDTVTHMVFQELPANGSEGILKRAHCGL